MDRQPRALRPPPAYRFFRRSLEQLIRVVNHVAWLNDTLYDSKGKSLGSNRANLLQLVRGRGERGAADARRKLEVPRAPRHVLYLARYAFQLVGRSGVGMDGAAPLSPPVIESWARQRRIRLHPDEFDALLRLDSTIRHPRDPFKDD